MGSTRGDWLPAGRTSNQRCGARLTPSASATARSARRSAATQAALAGQRRAADAPEDRAADHVRALDEWLEHGLGAVERVGLREPGLVGRQAGGQGQPAVDRRQRCGARAIEPRHRGARRSGAFERRPARARCCGGRPSRRDAGFGSLPSRPSSRRIARALVRRLRGTGCVRGERREMPVHVAVAVGVAHADELAEPLGSRPCRR